jgi:hypothetical protein
MEGWSVRDRATRARWTSSATARRFRRRSSARSWDIEGLNMGFTVSKDEDRISPHLGKESHR